MTTWQPDGTAEHVARWGLVPDGPGFSTPSSHLLPVRLDGAPAMLKVARADEERDGGRLMVWWAGRGAARVLRHSDDAIVLERATGPRVLTDLASRGSGSSRWMLDDARATRTLCRAAARLHANTPEAPVTGAPGPGPVGGAAPPDGLVPLRTWFRDLLDHRADAPAPVHRAAAVARELLADEQEVVVLHGDLHHGNVLDAGDRWVAIDPKFLVGDRAFDHANIVCNPTPDVALVPGRLDRQVRVICETADLDRERFLRWVVAWTGLSATWHAQGSGGAWSPADAVLEIGRTAGSLLCTR